MIGELRQPCSVKELASLGGVSDKTTRRDLRFLKEFGPPLQVIVEEHGRKRLRIKNYQQSMQKLLDGKLGTGRKSRGKTKDGPPRVNGPRGFSDLSPLQTLAGTLDGTSAFLPLRDTECTCLERSRGVMSALRSSRRVGLAGDEQPAMARRATASSRFGFIASFYCPRARND
jgi:hypothetical protein